MQVALLLTILAAAQSLELRSNAGANVEVVLHRGGDIEVHDRQRQENFAGSKLLRRVDVEAGGSNLHANEAPCKHNASADGMQCETFVNAALYFLNNQNKSMGFAELHIEPEVQDSIYDFDGDGDWRTVVAKDKEPKLLARLELMRHMYAARHAFVALSGLAGEEAEKQRKKLKKHYLEVPDGYVTSWSEATQDVLKRAKLAKDLHHVLESQPVQQLLEVARGCALPHDHDRFGYFKHLNQRSRVRPEGPITKDSYILLSEPDGTITEKDDLKMPLMTLGTGYGDCYQGLQVHYPTPGNKGVQKSTRAEGYPSKGFYKQAVLFGIKAIDTAYIYGTEEQIGKELPGTENNAANVFISTKSMSPAFRNMLGVSHGTDRMAEQLRYLHRKSVNVLYNHHDDEDDVEWSFLEKKISEGQARALGSSGLRDAIGHERCVKQGKCKYHVSVVQEDISPCNPRSHKTRQRIQREAGLFGNVTLVGHSAIQSCEGEPIIMNVAKRLGKSVAQVATRAILEQGVPLVVQTTEEKHLRQDLAAFDFELSKGDLNELALIQKLYTLDRELFGV